MKPAACRGIGVGERSAWRTHGKLAACGLSAQERHASVTGHALAIGVCARRARGQ